MPLLQLHNTSSFPFQLKFLCPIIICSWSFCWFELFPSELETWEFQALRYDLEMQNGSSSMSTHTLLLYFIQNCIMVGLLFHFPFNIWFYVIFPWWTNFNKFWLLSLLVVFLAFVFILFMQAVHDGYNVFLFEVDGAYTYTKRYFCLISVLIHLQKCR